MKKPDIVPHNSDWPMLYDYNLQGIVFYHKLGQGKENAKITIKENLSPVIHIALSRIP